MNVQVLQHVPFEGPGSIADWCIAGGHVLHITPLYLPEAILPEMNTIDLLVIMGGPMNVYDDAVFPWLAAEKEFIRAYLQAGKPVLGICLGAQLLALCSGVNVGRARHSEIGWFPAHATRAAEAFPWFHSLFADEPVLFHWHGDRFEIPAGAENLVSTKANDNQAFILADGLVIGLQFHPEITPVLLEQMVAEGRDELGGGGFVQSAETIVGSAEYRDAGMVMHGVLEYLAGVSLAKTLVQ
ncbi:type 1 glutamine amidotransferase [Puia sp.]|jgi:GMP synthase-like glutamine amidotransferase|uniref:type 1 glutamine amidotransferase n=1 Tax=Puia sp. TaxID=2045100 RepID=UPI002F3E654F